MLLTPNDLWILLVVRTFALGSFILWLELREDARHNKTSKVERSALHGIPNQWDNVLIRIGVQATSNEILLEDCILLWREGGEV